MSISHYKEGRALLAALPTTEHNTGDAILVQVTGDVGDDTHTRLIVLGWKYDAFYHGYLFPLPSAGIFA